jgi:putative endonuclease
MSAPGNWFVYVLRCADGSLYTGITTDAVRRLAEHNGEAAGGARYTRSRRPVTLAHVEVAADRAAATRREAAIRRLDRARKLALCEGTPRHGRNA